MLPALLNAISQGLASGITSNLAARQQVNQWNATQSQQGIENDRNAELLRLQQDSAGREAQRFQLDMTNAQHQQALQPVMDFLTVAGYMKNFSPQTWNNIASRAEPMVPGIGNLPYSQAPITPAERAGFAMPFLMKGLESGQDAGTMKQIGQTVDRAADPNVPLFSQESGDGVNQYMGSDGKPTLFAKNQASPGGLFETPEQRMARENQMYARRGQTLQIIGDPSFYAMDSGTQSAIIQDFEKTQSALPGQTGYAWPKMADGRYIIPLRPMGDQALVMMAGQLQQAIDQGSMTAVPLAKQLAKYDEAYAEIANMLEAGHKPKVANLVVPISGGDGVTPLPAYASMSRPGTQSTTAAPAVQTQPQPEFTPVATGAFTPPVRKIYESDHNYDLRTKAAEDAWYKANGENRAVNAEKRANAQFELSKKGDARAEAEAAAKAAKQPINSRGIDVGKKLQSLNLGNNVSAKHAMNVVDYGLRTGMLQPVNFVNGVQGWQPDYTPVSSTMPADKKAEAEAHNKKVLAWMDDNVNYIQRLYDFVDANPKPKTFFKDGRTIQNLADIIRRAPKPAADYTPKAKYADATPQEMYYMQKIYDAGHRYDNDATLWMVRRELATRSYLRR